MAIVRILKPYKSYNSGELIGRSQADADELVASGVGEAVSEAEWLALQSKEPGETKPEPEVKEVKPEVRPEIRPRR